MFYYGKALRMSAWLKTNFHITQNAFPHKP